MLLTTYYLLLTTYCRSARILSVQLTPSPSAKSSLSRQKCQQLPSRTGSPHSLASDPSRTACSATTPSLRGGSTPSSDKRHCTMSTLASPHRRGFSTQSNGKCAHRHRPSAVDHMDQGPGAASHGRVPGGANGCREWHAIDHTLGGVQLVVTCGVR